MFFATDNTDDHGCEIPNPKLRNILQKVTKGTMVEADQNRFVTIVTFYSIQFPKVRMLESVYIGVIRG